MTIVLTSALCILVAGLFALFHDMSRLNTDALTRWNDLTPWQWCYTLAILGACATIIGTLIISLIIKVTQ